MSVQVERRPILTSAIGRRRPAVFGIVADGAERRRPSDLVRVALAVILVALTAASAEWLGRVERWAQDVIAALPSGLDGLYRVFYPWAVVVCAGALVVASIVAR